MNLNKRLKHNLIFLLILGISPMVGFAQQSVRDTFRLFFLGGQSNMEGHGKNLDLPDDFKSNMNKSWIFQGNSAPDENTTGGMGKWDKLSPGYGARFTSDGIKNTLSNKFGPELSFAKKMQEFYPNEKIAIIKYARGGTSLDSLAAREHGSWEMDYRGTNGVNQFDHFLNTITNALKIKDIDKNGVEDFLMPCGIIWMQGESDGTISEEVAQRYYANLKRMMDIIRASLLVDDIAVVIGKISDSGNNKAGKVWQYGELIQHAQEKYVRTDRNAAIVRSTKDYKYSDMWHYNSAGYIDLGEKFAEAVYRLHKN
jgi:Carbohydrate esterase, sialic acid-specific acetylesterase